MALATQTPPAPSQPTRHALPDPGECVPLLAWPTVGMFAAAFSLFFLGTWGALAGALAPVATIALNGVAIFVMFTVLHDACHFSISTKRWVNAVFGRAALLFVSPPLSFGAYGFIHIEHHRHSNDHERDPDSFASDGPWWQLPVRWLCLEPAYVIFYLRNAHRRPRAELAETAALSAAALAAVVALTATGNIRELAVIYLLPHLVALMALAWWFDWLPHHGLEDTQRDNRYRATRTRVGMEWLLTPLMLSQNYHLVHHLHPSIPFYRYVSTWRRNEEAYLDRDAAISTAFGQQLDPGEYREWKELNRKLLRVLPVRMPKRSAAGHAVFHPLTVAAVEPLTDDSVLIGFDVPEELREEFAFEAGQHVTVRTDFGGEGVRRNYSICSPATGGELRIAIKHIPGGAFSSFAADRLRPGDTLELMTPTGEFGVHLDPLHEKHYVAIAAGSGITPILSILATTLEIETESRFTLIYGNRTNDSAMFGSELEVLESRFSDRLEVLRVFSREPHHVPELSGRIDGEKLDRWLTGSLSPADVDEWFLCGPVELGAMARERLIDHGADPDRIHLELFFGYERDAAARDSYAPATATMRLSGEERTVELKAGETILEAALGAGEDAPYACMGGACGTCKARLLSGEVEMDQNFALGRADVEAGYVLTCQAHPTTPEVAVDYDG